MTKRLTPRQQSAMAKMANRPQDLRPDDIIELKDADPWLARTAVARWREATEREYQKTKRKTVVVRVDPRFRR